MSNAQTIPLPGFCQCGCGDPAPLASRTRPDLGHVKGQPIKFILGHNGTIPAQRGHKHCPGCGEEKRLREFTKQRRSDRGVVKPRARCRDCTSRDNRKKRLANPPKKYLRLTTKETLQLNRERVREWRLKNPDKRRRQAIRDYLRRRGVPLVGESRAYAEQILLNDLCVYCGEERGSTMDHIVPVSVGGDSHWSNLASACLRCNSGKGNKPLIEYLLHRRDMAT